MTKPENPKTDSDRSTVAPLMVRANGAALMIDVSPATWHRMNSAGKTPAPIRLSSGTVRWRWSDLESWVSTGCPDRKTWEAQNKA